MLQPPDTIHTAHFPQRLVNHKTATHSDAHSEDGPSKTLGSLGG